MATDAGKRETHRTLLLWTGWFIGPAAWGLHLLVSYVLVPWVCRTGEYWTLHGVTLVTFLLATAGMMISWRQWTSVGRGALTGPGDPSVRRVRFMAVGGLLISALSALIILVEGLPGFVLSACI